MQKTFSHIGLGEVVYTKRLRCRAIKISVSLTKGVRVSLPFYTSYSTAVNFVDANLAKITTILQKQRDKTEQDALDDFGRKMVFTPDELNEIRKRAHKELPGRIEALAEKLNATIVIKDGLGIRKNKPFNYGRLAIKNNRTNWGSCSSVGNINLNMHLINLPDELIDFVIIHELCHLVYHNHSPRFHELVNLVCNGREKELSKKVKGMRVPTCLTQ
ncbi:MAG: M48 family metallopeptidase [Bacteroidales bacterium]